MKKVIFAILFLSMPAAARDVYRSSATATPDAAQVLCGAGRRGHLYGVCVSSAVAATGITVYNSSFTTAVQNTGFITNATVGCQYYQTNYGKGLMYTKTGTANVNILYDCN